MGYYCTVAKLLPDDAYMISAEVSSGALYSPSIPADRDIRSPSPTGKVEVGS